MEAVEEYTFSLGGQGKPLKKKYLNKTQMNRRQPENDAAIAHHCRRAAKSYRRSELGPGTDISLSQITKSCTINVKK